MPSGPSDLPPERSGGGHAWLAAAAPFERFSRLVGGQRALELFAQDHVRAESGCRLLDVGCGTGTLLDFLPPDVSYLGFDPNPEYVSRAIRLRTRTGAEFRVSAIREEESLASLRTFDVVVACAVLHHVDDTEARRLAMMAYALLRPGGRLVTLDPVRSPGQPILTRLVISLDRGRHVRTLDAYRALLTPTFSEIAAHRRRDLLSIPYEHGILEAVRR